MIVFCKSEALCWYGEKLEPTIKTNLFYKLDVPHGTSNFTELTKKKRERERGREREIS